MDRRVFLRQSCLLCAALGSGVLAGSLSSCASVSTYETESVEGKVFVPRSTFAESDLQIIRVTDSQYDIALLRKPDGSFRALFLRCTHAEFPLSSSPGGFACPAHGSRFNLEGLVMRGPAQRDLTELPVAAGPDRIIITFDRKALQ